MNSVVVGASGQIGAALVQVLKERGHKVLSTHAHHPSPESQPFDLRDADPEKLLAGHGASLVFCPAGATHVDACEDDPKQAALLNFQGPLSLLRAARDRGAKFIYYSSEYVFDGRQGPYQEGDPPKPLSVYGLTKFGAEQEILSLDPSALVLRTTVVYGPDPQEKNSVCQLRNFLGTGRPFKAPKDQITTPTFNMDIARLSVELALSGRQGVYHMAGKDLLSRYDFALKACRIFGWDEKLLSACLTKDLNQKALRPLKAGLLCPRLNKFCQEMGLEKPLGVEEGLARTKAGMKAKVKGKGED